MLLFNCSVISDSWSHELQHARIPCSSLSPGICSNSCPLSQWCHSTISSSVVPLLLLPLIFPSIWVFSNESALRIRWSKHWSFSFSISSSNEYSGLISFRIDWFDLPLLSRGFPRVFFSITVWKHQFFGAQPYLMTTGKTIALIIQTFIGKVKSLLFNMLSRFVIAFPPRSKHLLISWWQWLSTVILEPKKIQSIIVSISPIYLPQNRGPLNDHKEETLPIFCYSDSSFSSYDRK